MDLPTTLLIDKCLCGESGFTRRRINGVLCDCCLHCGVEHQVVRMTPQQLGDWYRTQYHAGIYTHSYEQDLKVGRMRVASYSSYLKGHVLDVGSGNGAFVNAAVEKGIDAWGQEISDYAGNGRIYTGDLDQTYFPTEHFDVVTLHDVLEHLPDPRTMLSEILRILKPDGWLIVEFPDFRAERHWKEIEHLWMLTLHQLADLLGSAGFKVVYYVTPVSGKFTVFCKRPVIQRRSFLLPPGIGDSYWSLVKLPGLMKKLDLETVDLYISDGDDNRRRSLEWIRKIPWAHAAGYRKHSLREPVFKEAYLRSARYLFQNIAGCDYFLAFNGRLRYGADLDQLEPEWGADWYPPLFRPIEQRQQIKKFQAEYGPYVVAYFVPHGMYRSWLKEMPTGRITRCLRRIKEAGFQIVFMGAEWDVKTMQASLAQEVKGIDLSGQTTIDEMFALLEGAAGTIGWPAGNTFMSVMLRRQTLLFWNKYFDKRFWSLSCPPDSREDWYHWIETNGDTYGATRDFIRRISDASAQGHSSQGGAIRD